MAYGNVGLDGDCPVSMEILGKLFRADLSKVGEMVVHYSQEQRSQLALFCYARQHLRQVGLAIAARCDDSMLIRLAGESGQVLAAQSKANVSRFGRRDIKQVGFRANVSLAGAQAA